MSHIFISYSRNDTEFALRLGAALQADGREVWRDKNKERGIPPSADWQDEIRRALIAAESVIFVISPSSITSENCAKEIAQAVENRLRITMGGVSPSSLSRRRTARLS